MASDRLREALRRDQELRSVAGLLAQRLEANTSRRLEMLAVEGDIVSLAEALQLSVEELTGIVLFIRERAIAYRTEFPELDEHRGR